MRVSRERERRVVGERLLAMVADFKSQRWFTREDNTLSAGAYYSQDFEWETLRDEVSRMPGHPIVDSHESLASSEEDSVARDEAPSTSTSWETFHTRHSRNLFFKERRYLTKEFPELCDSSKSLLLLEVGCGTGSSVVPVIRANKQAVVYACDCSAAALKKASEVVTAATSSSVFHPFLCDISISKLPDFISCSNCRRGNDATAESTNASGDCCTGGLDIVTLIFTLSAIPVERMLHVLLECFQAMKPGGLLLFRDYGLYDMTMLRFAPRQRVSGCLYRRDDGTLSYFFSLEVVRELFTRAGFVERELEYCCVQLVNRRKGVPMKRVWVHAKFQKP